MATHRHTLIAKEGWPLLSLAIGIAAMSYVFAGLAVATPFILLCVFFFVLFRDPPRKIPASPLGLVSPVDGTIVAIDERYDEFLNRQAMYLSIEMNWYGVYTIRSPMEGKVIKQWSSDDGAQDAKELAGGLQGKSAQWIQSDEGDDIIVCMTNDNVARRSGFQTRSGERIGQGKRCGFVHFRAVIDLLLPHNVLLEIKKGDKVLAGSDIVATLVHKN